MSSRRIFAMLLRHLYHFRHNLDKLVDAFYWPVLDIIVWGMTFGALEKAGGVSSQYIHTIIFGVILWYVLWRGQYEITVSILEEFWSENLVNLFSSPLKKSEWIVSLFLLGIIKLLLTLSFTTIVGFFLYKANILTLFPGILLSILILLLTGWVFGLFVGGLFLRKGTNIQSLAWAGGFILMPFSAVYYPLDSLPVWVQHIAQFFPSMYAFEGMRMVQTQGYFPPEMALKAAGLLCILGIFAAIFFIRSFQKAIEKGLSHIK
jgi:ABC-2 type transport system permease protein